MAVVKHNQNKPDEERDVKAHRMFDVMVHALNFTHTFKMINGDFFATFV